MNDNSGRREIHKLAMTATAGTPSVRGKLTVTQVDEIKVEQSSTTRFLRLRNGDLQCTSRVSILVDGEWHELTVDELPSD